MPPAKVLYWPAKAMPGVFCTVTVTFNAVIGAVLAIVRSSSAQYGPLPLATLPVALTVPPPVPGVAVAVLTRVGVAVLTATSVAVAVAAIRVGVALATRVGVALASWVGVALGTVTRVGVAVLASVSVGVGVAAGTGVEVGVRELAAARWSFKPIPNAVGLPL